MGDPEHVTRQEMKQLVNDLATLLAGIADDDAQRMAPAQRTEASREGHRNTDINDEIGRGSTVGRD